MYYESLWNHVVIQQGIFIRLKITSYIASWISNSKNSSSIWFLWFAIFRKKCKSSFANCQNASQIANCKWLIQTLHWSKNWLQVIKHKYKECLAWIIYTIPVLHTHNKIFYFLTNDKPVIKIVWYGIILLVLIFLISYVLIFLLLLNRKNIPYID